jgi:hypothetical protein
MRTPYRTPIFGVLLTVIGSGAYAGVLFATGPNGADGARLPVLQSPRTSPVIPDCKAADGDPPAATLASGAQSVVTLSLLSELKQGDQVVIGLLDGRTCPLRFKSIYGVALEVLARNQAFTIALTDVHFIDKHPGYWGVVGSTLKNGAEGMGPMCASESTATLVCVAVGGTIGAAAGAVRGLFDRPKRVYERRLHGNRP